MCAKTYELIIHNIYVTICKDTFFIFSSYYFIYWNKKNHLSAGKKNPSMVLEESECII